LLFSIDLAQLGLLAPTVGVVAAICMIHDDDDLTSAISVL
jgi:hypothetical protein